MIALQHRLHQAERAIRIDAAHGPDKIWQDGKYRTVGAIGRGTVALTDNIIRQCAPSVFAEAKHDRTSDRYSFVPTIDVVNNLRSEGWVPTLVQEQSVRDEGRNGFQKHLIRFAHRDALQKGGDRPEVVLVNSHDRSCAYQLDVGYFRAVCANGLVVCDATFQRRSIVHQGFEPGLILDATAEIVKSIPALEDTVNRFRGTQLDSAQRAEFAEAAAHLKWGAEPSITPDLLLISRRSEDIGGSLWSVFNRVQENLIRGGVVDRLKLTKDRRRLPATRAVRGIDSGNALNKGLWDIAEKFAAQLN